MSEAVGNGTETGAQTGAQAQTETGGAQTEQKETGAQSEPITTEMIEKMIQSRTDKATAELGKKISALQKENDKLKKEKMTADELQKYEADEKAKELAQKEKDILYRENKWFAMNAIKEAGLDDGSKLSMELVDFVMADTEEEISNRVKAFNQLVQSFVSAKVDEKFKAIGRTPEGATAQGKGKAENSIAEKLGTQRAEQMKKSNDVLNKYLGR